MILLSVILLLSATTPPICDDRDGDLGASKCWYEASLKADADLEAIWPPVLTAARDADRRFAPTSRKDKPSAADDLIAAQNAWIKYRDAQCAADADYAQGGSLENVIAGRCLTMMTRERIAKLKDIESGFREP